jgi:hypothetical protein
MKERRALWIVLIVCFGALLYVRVKSRRPATADVTHDPEILKMAAQLTDLQRSEQAAEAEVFGQELQAEKSGVLIEAFWNALNHSSNKWETLKGEWKWSPHIPSYNPPRKLAHGVEISEPSEPGKGLSPQETLMLFDSLRSAGWELAQSEFRQIGYETDDLGVPTRSTIYFAAHVFNTNQNSRAILEGNVALTWEGQDKIKTIDASLVKLRTRTGDAPFVKILSETLLPPQGSYFIDPLIVYDLDGDGVSEIILAAVNRVFRRGPNGEYHSEPLLAEDPRLIFTAVVGDFNGDGIPDFLCARFEGLVLYEGVPGGKFPNPGRLVWTAIPRLQYGQVLTCGDIEGDGDLDLFLAQYKPPYDKGQMPHPWYDANDGYPSFLLINDGKGNFSDATQTAGLQEKRWRRTYSASFADVDNDGDLDLVVVSDFSGVDLYSNDGHGHFTDVTSAWAPRARGFGMAHVLADFNDDGLLDLLMIGMNAPTADRLNSLRLQRTGQNDLNARQQATFGNRLLLWVGKQFQESPLGNSIARSGWSWGASAFDFDNDGWPDVYIANGHETKDSVQEYEPEFWLHDIYVGDSGDSRVKYAYFQQKMQNTRGMGYSYGGWERNRLFWNQQGRTFEEIGFLLGVGLSEDSRCVVTEDLDGDGRMDLLVTTFEVYPEKKQTLQIFKNDLPDPGNWIGFKLREERGLSPVGAKITIHHDGHAQTKQLVTGDSYRSQHSTSAHFGLGQTRSIDRAEILWRNGKVVTLPNPGLNRWHLVRSTN